MPATPAQSKPAQPQPSQAPPPSQAKPSTPEEIMRQRILLRERFNKGWDIQPETPKERERRCKNEAKKQFSALHPRTQMMLTTAAIEETAHERRAARRA